MQALRRGMVVAGILAALVTARASAEELVIWTRTNGPAEDKALKQIFAQFEAANRA